MRILVVTGSDSASQVEAICNFNPFTATIKKFPGVKVVVGENEVHYKAIRSEHDAESLRGLRYDLIIEDGSFNQERSHVKGALLSVVQRIVLR